MLGQSIVCIDCQRFADYISDAISEVTQDVDAFFTFLAENEAKYSKKKTDEETIMQYARNLYVAEQRDYSHYIESRNETDSSLRGTEHYDKALSEAYRALVVKGIKYATLVNPSFNHNHRYLTQIASLGAHFRNSPCSSVNWMSETMDKHGAVSVILHFRFLYYPLTSD